MIDSKKLKTFKNIVDSLMLKYDMYYTNKLYKSSHFKTDDEYLIIQKNLATEIELSEKSIKDFLKTWFSLNFKNVIFIAYDSRFICINKTIKRIGKVLLKNADNESIQKSIKDNFTSDTEFSLITESYEDLPEEVQKKFTF